MLQSLGLVETTKRVGIRVLPPHRWNPFDPQVIRWRLAGEGRGAQLRSLAELRSAVEPVAAELAAVNAPDDLRRELPGGVPRNARRRPGRRRAPVPGTGHPVPLAAVRSGSGNEMFANLVGQVAETLTGRTVHGLMPDRPRDVVPPMAPGRCQGHFHRRRRGSPRGVQHDHAPDDLGDGAGMGRAAAGVRPGAAPASDPAPKVQQHLAGFGRSCGPRRRLRVLLLHRVLVGDDRFDVEGAVGEGGR